MMLNIQEKIFIVVGNKVEIFVVDWRFYLLGPNGERIRGSKDQFMLLNSG